MDATPADDDQRKYEYHGAVFSANDLLEEALKQYEASEGRHLSSSEKTLYRYRVRPHISNWLKYAHQIAFGQELQMHHFDIVWRLFYEEAGVDYALDPVSAAQQLASAAVEFDWHDIMGELAAGNV